MNFELRFPNYFDTSGNWKINKKCSCKTIDFFIIKKTVDGKKTFYHISKIYFYILYHTIILQKEISLTLSRTQQVGRGKLTLTHSVLLYRQNLKSEEMKV